MPESPLVLSFKQIDADDQPLVGQKAVKLGEMAQAGIPIPKGFVITTPAYEQFIFENQLNPKVKEVLSEVDTKDPDNLSHAATLLQGLILKNKIGQDLESTISKTYNKFFKKIKSQPVKVISAPVIKTSKDIALDPHHSKFENIKGGTSLSEHTKKGWANFFTPGSIHFLKESNLVHTDISLATIIIEQINPDVAGTVHTIDPESGEKDRIVIQAILGLPRIVDQGKAHPDRYTLKKDNSKILAKEVVRQSTILSWSNTSPEEKPVSKNKQDKQKLTKQQIKALARLASKVQNHFYYPQEITWFHKNDKFYITHTQDFHHIKLKTKEKNEKKSTSPILKGTPVSKGTHTGPVKTITKDVDVPKVSQDDVIVAQSLHTDHLSAIKKAGAVIAETGGVTSHSAILARDLGVPAIFGAQNALKTLKDGDIVTLDAGQGSVYLGKKVIEQEIFTEKPKPTQTKTATKLYINLLEPNSLKKDITEYIDGVGILRSELLITNYGTHPKKIIKNGQEEHFTSYLAKKIKRVSKAVHPKPVLYRASDLRSTDYLKLSGGNEFEQMEENPAMGLHGAARHTASPDTFMLEINALKKVRKKYPNTHLLIPFVRNPIEFKRIKQIIKSQPELDTSTFKLWIMAEVPSIAVELGSYLDLGVDGVVIGTNDLTSLLYAADRDNHNVHINADTQALNWAVKKIIKACTKRNVPTSITGQLVSLNDSIISQSVKLGVTSISVNQESVFRVRQIISQCEKNMIS